MTRADLLDRLAAANPVSDAEPSTSHERSEARAVLERALATPLAASAPTARRPRARRWALPLGIGLAGAAAFAVALVSGLDDGRVQPAPATAAAVLERAAQAAERRPPNLFPRADQFFYVHSRGTNLSTAVYGDSPEESFTVLQTHDRQIWTSTSRPGRLQERDLAQRFLTPLDRRRWIEAGRPRIQGRGSLSGARIGAQRAYYIGNEPFTRAQLLRLRIAPRALYRRLLAGVASGQGHSPNGEVFTQIGDALREQPAPPRLRAALYRALAYVRGIELVGPVRDRLGRRGTAVALVEGGIRHELVFDPETSVMLAERDVVLRPVRGLNAKRRAVIGDTVYIARGVVDSPRERPPAR